MQWQKAEVREKKEEEEELFVLNQPRVPVEVFQQERLVQVKICVQAQSMHCSNTLVLHTIAKQKI